LSNKGLLIFPTFAKIYESVAAMSALNDVTRGILTKLKDLLTSTDETIDIAVGQTTSISTVPYQYLINQLQAAIANNQALIDAAVSDTITKIRYSKLDNPLVHLFKKNKLVDTLKGQLSWTRDSGATYIYRYGKLQYSPSPYATNLCVYSEDLANVAWLPANCTVTANATTAPDGSLNAAELNDSDVAQGGYIRDVITIPNPMGKKVAQSIFIKRGTSRYTSMRLAISGGTVIFGTAVYDWELDLVINAGSEISGSVIDAGNGWKRFTTLIQDDNSGNTTLDTRYYPSSATNVSEVGTTYMWGAQVESRVNIGNGYVKTEGASVSGKSYVGIDITRQEKEGWLIEGGSTNLALNSGDFNSGWDGSATVGTSDFSLDGVNNAFLINDIQGNESLNLSVSFVSDTIHTVSFYLKQGTALKTSIAITSPNITFVAVRYNWITKVASSNSGGNALAKATELKDGWIRLELTTVVNTGMGIGTIRVYPSDNAVSAEIGSVNATHAQVEKLPLASSYMPTTDAAATRVDDFVFFPTYENVPSGDISIHSRMELSKCSTDTTLWGYDSGNSAIRLRYSTNGKLRFFTKNNGAFTNSLDSNVLVPGWYTVTIVISDVVTTIYVDGVVVVSGSSQDRTSDITKEFLLGGSTGRLLHSDFRIYDFALNADEVSFLAGE
jgi:hypothetical protein